MYYLKIINLWISLVKFSTIYYFIIILIFGYLFKKYGYFKLFYRGDIAIFSTVLFTYCIYQKYFYDINFDLFENEFGRTLPTVITFICGISITIYFSKFRFISELLINCSKASFFILSLHIVLGNFILGPILNSFIYNPHLANILTFILTIFSCLFIYNFNFRTKYIKYLFLPVKAIR